MGFDPNLKELARHQDAIDRLALVQERLRQEKHAAERQRERPARLVLLLVIISLVGYAVIRM